MWTAIALTCQDVEAATTYQNELNTLKLKGLFSDSVPLLVIEDSVPGLGSGGSTLNALLIVAEHLCAKNGFTVLTNEILSDARILIVHTGRNFIFDPCGRAFVDFPAVTVTKSGHELRLNTFVHLYLSITEQLSACETNVPAGVWVCGSDGVFILDPDNCFNWLPQSPSGDIIAFTIPVSPNVAAQHGVYKLNETTSFVDDVLYQKGLEQIEECILPEYDSQVPLTLALMFMSTKVADAILRLHNIYPMTCSTYIGEDSGVTGFKLSLFFDFLLPTCANVSESDFLSGARAESMGMPGNPKLHGDHCEERDAFVNVMPLARKLIWDALRPFRTQADSSLKHCHFYHCGSLLANKNENYQNFANSDSSLFCFFDNIPLSSSMKKYNVNVFVHTNKYKNFNNTLQSNLDCKQEDLFINLSSTDTDACLHAKESLDASKIYETVDLKRHFDFKKSKSCQISLEFISQTLIADKNLCLLPVFASLCVDGYANQLLETLDKLTETCKSTGICARTLSCIADVCGLLAIGNGGLRSGPAMHKDWIKVFKLLEQGQVAHGLQAMATLRSFWMDTPFRLIRAARHYEAAAQIFIRETVKQTKNFISVQKSLHYTDYGIVHGARASARIDMAGGWSDTPPITYEHGGSVVNVAIRIDAQKPVGAKTLLIQKPIIKAYCISDDYKQTVTFRTITDIGSYANPTAPGALVAAVLVCAEVVDPTLADVSLEDQLTKKFNGGFEIYYWSNVPQGSGLGTSSILAGCLLASVWRAIGVQFNVESILHAVLYIEQLLTTGGGWQDQVGGLCPGVKIGRFSTRQDFGRIIVEQCNLSSQAYQWLNDRLLLIYTGKTRLAKNLLQEVVRNWYARKADIVQIVDDLVLNAERCKLALEDENWETVAECTKLYWEQKKFMAPGSEPAAVADLLTYFYNNKLIFSGWLAGAGGGGFLYLISQDPKNVLKFKNILSNCEAWKTMSVHEVDIDLDPFQFFTE